MATALRAVGSAAAVDLPAAGSRFFAAAAFVRVAVALGRAGSPAVDLRFAAGFVGFASLSVARADLLRGFVVTLDELSRLPGRNKSLGGPEGRGSAEYFGSCPKGHSVSDGRRRSRRLPPRGRTERISSSSTERGFGGEEAPREIALGRDRSARRPSRPLP
ncbi:hypothetical protein [Nannocystis pusilla]|uniref:hypothetical protein n=1 Tax=Nannocystis pusilla TaxID=889268 RepID=UPI003DA51E51